MNTYGKKSTLCKIHYLIENNRINNIVEKYKSVENCKKILDETKKYWRDIVNTIQVETPIESMNILLNGWLVYQTMASRLIGKTRILSIWRSNWL